MNALEEAIIGSGAGTLRPRTTKIYLRTVRDYVKVAGGEERGWTEASVTAWITSLCLRMQANSANTMLRSLSAVSRRAFAVGLIARDFALAVEQLPVVIEKSRHPVPLSVGKRILSACAGPLMRDKRDHALVSLGFYHGLRAESIVTIAFEDVDFDHDIITVTLKGGGRHRLPLDPRSKPTLLLWTDVLRRKGVSSGAVFRSIPCSGRIGDKCLSTTSLYNIVRRRAAQAGIANFHPHLMRHSFISWAVANGATFDQIRSVIGPETEAMIMWYTGDAREDGEEPKKLIPDLQ